MRNGIIFTVIGFTILIVGGVYHQKCLVSSSQKLLEYVNTIEFLVNHDKISEANEKMIELKENWEKVSKVWKILIYHDEIQPIYESLVEVCADLGKKSKDSQISPNFELLKMYISNVSKNNEFILENIL